MMILVTQQIIKPLCIATTTKPVLSGHPWDPSKCLLNTGCPLKTGSLRIRLKRVILIYSSDSSVL